MKADRQSRPPMKVVLRVLRTLLRVPAPTVSRNQAIEIALAELDRRGFSPPKTSHGRELDAIEGIRAWTVLLDPGVKPCRRMVVDNRTGEVIKFERLLR